MAKISRRLGRLGVDWRDAEGKRRWKTFKGEHGEEDARIFLGQKLIESGRPQPADISVTLAEYAPKWLAVAAVRVRLTSLARYRRLLRRYLLPGLGLLRVRDVTAPVIRDWLAQKVTGGLARSTVSGLLAVLHGIMQLAQEDGIVQGNPAAGLSKRLGLGRAWRQRAGTGPMAMTPEQLGAFLDAARDVASSYPALYLLAMTGLRVGEACGLQWTDVNAGEGVIRVERQLTESGELTEPKTPRSRRTVDAPPGLILALSDLRTKRRESDLAAGVSSPWVLRPWGERPTAHEAHATRVWLRESMARALRRAGLPTHFTPHSLRHTYASIHLSRGESPKYVQEQLGHESIQVTVDLYGRWLPTRSPKAAADFERSIRKS